MSELPSNMNDFLKDVWPKVELTLIPESELLSISDDKTMHSDYQVLMTRRLKVVHATMDAVDNDISLVEFEFFTARNEAMRQIFEAGHDKVSANYLSWHVEYNAWEAIFGDSKPFPISKPSLGQDAHDDGKAGNASSLNRPAAVQQVDPEYGTFKVSFLKAWEQDLDKREQELMKHFEELKKKRKEFDKRQDDLIKNMELWKQKLRKWENKLISQAKDSSSRQ
ncbi:uncharacterized protein CTHT_0015020 [Thermochaetoides thermophila DSM 1495]|uniref:Uncharacterized protein n=1 Tax=Chaetomium thermophilum (strain DSM 1495 / CBS 144.50 / IMI 039719) TaxID=759272 RepID=G0S1W0_CHATD|nr:hypothetical protein CTHT_0015020 [Thermochaetoides thermophila DSM 1495]EGS23020.1 hypothetical protein CTHT_0015020 [Thermochaetoides thermophila DSM 1495]